MSNKTQGRIANQDLPPSAGLTGKAHLLSLERKQYYMHEKEKCQYLKENFSKKLYRNHLEIAREAIEHVLRTGGNSRLLVCVYKIPRSARFGTRAAGAGLLAPERGSRIMQRSCLPDSRQNRGK